jgi:hypothetical protein
MPASAASRGTPGTRIGPAAVRYAACASFRPAVSRSSKLPDRGVLQGQLVSERPSDHISAYAADDAPAGRPTFLWRPGDRTSQHHTPACHWGGVYGGYVPGTSPAHDGDMTSSRIQSLAEAREPWKGWPRRSPQRPDPDKPSLASCRAGLPIPRRYGHSITTSAAASTGWRRPVRRPAPAADTNGPGPPPSTSTKRRTGRPEYAAFRVRQAVQAAVQRDKTGADRQNERLCEPLVPPGRCHLYVRSHCYASTHGDT